jgi:hypothetical protein
MESMYLPMQLTDGLLVEMALLLIGLTRISLTKTGFNPPSANKIPYLAAAAGTRYAVN